MSLSVVILLVGNLTVTSYRSVPGQTDATPFETATGERVCHHGAAISQDLLCPACMRLHRRCDHPETTGKIHYGDQVYVEGFGFKTINDCMGRYKHYHVKTKDGVKHLKYRQDTWIDIWVPNYKAEHEFHSKNGFKKHEVYLIKGKYEKADKRE